MPRLFFEMAGSSGVGKTTLLQATLPKLQRRYLLRSNLDMPTDFEGGHVLLNLFLDKLKGDKPTDKITPFQRIKKYQFLIRTLMRDMTAQAVDSDVFLDEGIVQHFGAQIRSVSDDDLKCMLSERVIIFLFPRTPRTIANQIIDRSNKEKVTRLKHKGLGYEHLLSKAQSNLALTRQTCQRCEEVGLQTLILYAEDGLETNADRIVQLEASLCEKQPKSSPLPASTQ